jgi:CDP-diacylglycerol---serine O-phosphatidyltransferase
MKKHLPNFLTCCNLLCGALGILFILRTDQGPDEFYSGHWHAAYFVWASCVFDFFDGFAARVLKVSSAIGKELDSLADMVSFGLLPALFMFSFIEQQSKNADTSQPEFVPYVALLIAVFSALRLAVFNVDETQKDSFRGVPTPANTLFLTGLPFIPFEFHPLMLVAISLICSFLLVSRIELFALKFKDFSWGGNKVRFTFLLISALLVIGFHFAAIPLIIILYVLLSLGVNALNR